VQTDFDSKGKILEQQIYESVICSKARLNYDEVDVLFAGKESDLPEELKQISFGGKSSFPTFNQTTLRCWLHLF
jgi:exoribonuclease R